MAAEQSTPTCVTLQEHATGFLTALLELMHLHDVESIEATEISRHVPRIGIHFKWRHTADHDMILQGGYIELSNIPAVR